MIELTGGARAVIEALIGAPVAWRSPVELASATGIGLEETTDHLADLDAGGWLAAWDRPDELVVTLSVGAASRLEVRLVESGPSGTPRWARRSEPDPPTPRSPGLFRGERAAALGLVVDPRPGPPEQAGRAEEAVRRSAGPALPAGAEPLPRPTILLGTGLTPWPGPVDRPGDDCPACRSSRLGPSTYCLRCDRWGLDHRLKPGPAARPAPRLDRAEEARRADQQRRARKRKRRDRRSAQAEVGRPPRRPPGP